MVISGKERLEAQMKLITLREGSAEDEATDATVRQDFWSEFDLWSEFSIDDTHA